MDHGGGLPGMFACLPYWWALWPAWELRVSGALSSLWKADLGDSTDCLIKLMFCFLRVCDLVDIGTLIYIYIDCTDNPISRNLQHQNDPREKPCFCHVCFTDCLKKPAEATSPWAVCQWTFKMWKSTMKSGWAGIRKATSTGCAA